MPRQTISIVTLADSEPPTICPRCEQLCRRGDLVAGICPACKRNCQSAHSKILKSADVPAPNGGHKIQPNGFFDESGHLVPIEEARNIASDDSENTFADSIRQAVQKSHDLIERCWLQVQAYEKKHGDPVMAQRCAWLLLGFPVLAGADDLESLVRLLRPRLKQTVNKCLQFLQSQVPELPPLPNQRKPEARRKMREARNCQLTRHEPPSYGKTGWGRGIG